MNRAAYRSDNAFHRLHLRLTARTEQLVKERKWRKAYEYEVGVQKHFVRIRNEVIARYSDGPFEKIKEDVTEWCRRRIYAIDMEKFKGTSFREGHERNGRVTALREVIDMVAELQPWIEE